MIEVLTGNVRSLEILFKSMVNTGTAQIGKKTQEGLVIRAVRGCKLTRSYVPENAHDIP